MRRFLFPILFLAAGPAFGADGKITVEQGAKLLAGLRNLDGRMIVVKQNGADNVVMDPWQFGSGKLRLRISNDINILEAGLKITDAARQAVFREQASKAGDRLCKGEKRPPECIGGQVTTLSTGMPERDEYDRQVKELDAQPVPGTQDLSRIRASELNLDRNEIPVTVLSALEPILDVDVK